MPFLFEKALGGINEVLGKCWRIYNSSDLLKGNFLNTLEPNDLKFPQEYSLSLSFSFSRISISTVPKEFE
jgi:hypothetical protein